MDAPDYTKEIHDEELETITKILAEARERLKANLMKDMEIKIKDMLLFSMGWALRTDRTNRSIRTVIDQGDPLGWVVDDCMRDYKKSKGIV